MKFKVGDVVRVKDNASYKEEFKGATGVITECSDLTNWVAVLTPIWHYVFFKMN